MRRLGKLGPPRRRQTSQPWAAVCARSRGDRPQHTRQRGPESSTRGQPQQQARRSACDATQDLLVVEGRVLSCAAGSDRVLQSKGEAITNPPRLALNLGRVSKGRPHVHTSNRKQRPASSATKALFSFYRCGHRESEPRVRYFLCSTSENWRGHEIHPALVSE